MTRAYSWTPTSADSTRRGTMPNRCRTPSRMVRARSSNSAIDSAAMVHQREGVFRRDADAAGPEPAIEARLLDQPRRRRLDQPMGGRLDRLDRLDRPGRRTRRKRVGADHGIGEERPHAHRVGVGGIDQHPLRRSQGQDRSPDVDRRRRRPGCGAEGFRQLCVPDRRTRGVDAQHDRHVEHQITVRPPSTRWCDSRIGSRRRRGQRRDAPVDRTPAGTRQRRPSRHRRRRRFASGLRRRDPGCRTCTRGRRVPR